MKAFVTGATGFAGQYLVKYLLGKGYIVTGTFFSNKANDRMVNGCNYIYFDLNGDNENLSSILQKESPDEIYHLAAVAATNESEYQKYYRVNFNGTLNFYEAIRKSGIDAKILYVGSANVYGNVPENRQPVKESEEMRPLNHYAVSKASADLLSYRYYCEGLNIVRVRPFNHTGFGQNENFVCPKIANQLVSIKNGNADYLQVGNLGTKRDFTDVRDVVRAYWTLLQEGQSGDVYNVCSGQAYSIKEIVDMFSKIIGVEVDIRQRKSLVRKVDIPVLVGDYGKINREVGWEPLFPIEETLKSLLRVV